MSAADYAHIDALHRAEMVKVIDLVLDAVAIGNATLTTKERARVHRERWKMRDRETYVPDEPCRARLRQLARRLGLIETPPRPRRQRPVDVLAPKVTSAVAWEAQRRPLIKLRRTEERYGA